LYAYEGLRLSRTRETQESSRLNQKIFHLEDGDEQRKRDESMREAARQDRERELFLSETEGERRGAGSANQWADEHENDAQFGYDVYEVAEKWWVEVEQSEIGKLGKGTPECGSRRHLRLGCKKSVFVVR
jgi:salicylate hydroxylase